MALFATAGIHCAMETWFVKPSRTMVAIPATATPNNNGNSVQYR